jgi:hypothetical protein
MEVKINREIQEYQENIFFGLNLRQLIFSILAIGAAVAIYFGLRDVLGTETVSWLCVIGALPFGAMGFIKYNGMSAEQFITAFIQSEFLTPKRLTLKGTDFYYDAVDDYVAKQHIVPDKDEDDEEPEFEEEPIGKKQSKKKTKKKGGTSYAQKSKPNPKKK